MRTVQKNIVGALIFSKDGKMFQGLKADGPHNVYNGCWHLPGGGLELGEDFIEGLKREIKEEIGLDISAFPITLIDDVGRASREKTLRETGERVIQDMHFYVYRVEVDMLAKDIPIHFTDNEFIEYQWTELKDLKNVKVTPPAVELFERLGYF